MGSTGHDWRFNLSFQSLKMFCKHPSFMHKSKLFAKYGKYSTVVHKLKIVCLFKDFIYIQKMHPIVQSFHKSKLAMIDFDANFFCLDELLHVNDLVRRETLQTPHKAHVFHYKILFPCLSCNKLPLQKNPLIVQYVDQKLPTKKLQMHLSSTLSWIHSQQEACAIYKILFTSAACQQPLILALLPQLL